MVKDISAKHNEYTHELEALLPGYNDKFQEVMENNGWSGKYTLPYECPGFLNAFTAYVAEHPVAQAESMINLDEDGKERLETVENMAMDTVEKLAQEAASYYGHWGLRDALRDAYRKDRHNPEARTLYLLSDWLDRGGNHNRIDECFSVFLWCMADAPPVDKVKFFIQRWPLPRQWITYLSLSTLPAQESGTFVRQPIEPTETFRANMRLGFSLHVSCMWKDSVSNPEHKEPQTNNVQFNRYVLIYIYI